MGTVIADISIHSSASGLGIEVQFEFPPTGEVIHLPLRDRRALDAIRDKAGSYLERVVAMAPHLRLTPGQAADALHVLQGAGGELAEMLAATAFVRLQDAFRAANPLWDREGWGDPEAPLPIVQLNCHDDTDTLPLELLPVFDLGELPAPRTDHELARAAARFLGFSAAVRRTVPAGTDADRIIHNDPALPVQFLRHRRLLSARREADFLAALGQFVSVEGPWPNSEDEKTVRAALLQALYSGEGLDGKPATDPPVQVHHFACHCDTTADLDDDYHLRLKGRKTHTISFGELRRAYRERYEKDRDDQRRRAIVVLNACASSRTNPRTAASFAQWFVRKGHRAFIGTETDVPDSVAGRFAAAFYGRLLEARRPLGEAVVWARRDLLRDFRNPLGLLYVVYGDTDLAVEHPRPGIYRTMS
jgi:CHAT domain